MTAMFEDLISDALIPLAGGDVDTTLRGVAVRLDASGGLVVQSAGVERIVNAGDVVHVR